MEDNKILENSELIEATNEMAVSDFKRGLMIGTGMVVANIAGKLLCNYVIKPTVAKIKVRRMKKLSQKAESIEEAKSNEIEPDFVEVQE